MSKSSRHLSGEKKMSKSLPQVRILLWYKGLFVLGLSIAKVLWKVLEYFLQQYFMSVDEKNPNIHTLKCQTEFCGSFAGATTVPKPLIGKYIWPPPLSPPRSVQVFKEDQSWQLTSFPCQKGLKQLLANSGFVHCKQYDVSHKSPSRFPWTRAASERNRAARSSLSLF